MKHDVFTEWLRTFTACFTFLLEISRRSWNSGATTIIWCYANILVVDVSSEISDRPHRRPLVLPNGQIGFRLICRGMNVRSGETKTLNEILFRLAASIGTDQVLHTF